MFARYFAIVSLSSLWKRPSDGPASSSSSDRPSKFPASLPLASQHCRPFPPPAAAAFLLPDKERNRPGSSAVNQCAILFSLCSFFLIPLRTLASSPYTTSAELSFCLIPRLPRPFLSPRRLSRALNPFFPPSVRFGDNNRRTNGANLQSRLANGRSRDEAVRLPDGTKGEVLRCVSVAASPRKFSAG